MNFRVSPHLTVRRVVMFAVLFTLLVAVYPIEYRATRIAVVVGVLVAFCGGLHLFWRSRRIRAGLIVLGLAPVILMCLPGRETDRKLLRDEYTRILRTYEGTRYVWGGESYLGIDCSGLVRKPLVFACLSQGMRRLNGALIRMGAWLWWNDASAMALRDGYSGMTIENGRGASVNELGQMKELSSLLRPGDLAVTADGIHVLAYLGGNEWIEADPQLNRVVRMATPSENAWFNVEVRVVRWRILKE
jgi:hypothetical protein